MNLTTYDELMEHEIQGPKGHSEDETFFNSAALFISNEDNDMDERMSVLEKADEWIGRVYKDDISEEDVEEFTESYKSHSS